MKPEKFEVPGSLYVVRYHPKRDDFLAWRPNVSALFSTKSDLLRFVRWAKGTPTGDAFRAWLNPPADVPEEDDPTKDTKTII
jgi:hypothetical protein